MSRDTLRGPGDIHTEEADVVVELISIGEREDAFEDAVGAEDDPVDFGEFDFAGGEGGSLAQAESGTFLGAVAGDLADAVAAGDDGARVAGFASAGPRWRVDISG